MRDRPRSMDRKIRVVIGVRKRQAAGTVQILPAIRGSDVSEIERWVEGLRLTASPLQRSEKSHAAAIAPGDLDHQRGGETAPAGG